jgi:hypothetical protein
MINKQTVHNTIGQGMAAYVDYLNNLRLFDLAEKLSILLRGQTEKLEELTKIESKAFAHLNLAKNSINNVIEINRGGRTGVHGFIAEYAEAGIVNSRRALDGLRDLTTVIGNNGLADLKSGRSEVQMKFYNNLLSELKESSKYTNLKMMFPKDHVEVFEKAMNGEPNIAFRGEILSNSKITNIRKLIEEESSLRNEPYTKWMRPSALNYNEVQKDAIHQTLAKEKENIKANVTSQKTNVEEETLQKEKIAYQESKANFGEASKVAVIGAATQGGLNFGIFVYNKHKEGVNIWDFSLNDWYESGVQSARGALKGGVTGYSIYGLTNVCRLSAPSAGALTTGTFGLMNAIIQYRSGQLDDDGFTDLVLFNSIDASGAAIGAAIGQTVIPIPIVGALLGSIITSTAMQIGKGILSRKEIAVLNRYQAKIDNYISNLDSFYQVEYNELMSQYLKIGELQDYSFKLDFNIELQFIASIDLANLTGVYCYFLVFDPYDNVTTCFLKQKILLVREDYFHSGADNQIRTGNLSITSGLLYHWSYVGTCMLSLQNRYSNVN